MSKRRTDGCGGKVGKRMDQPFEADPITARLRVIQIIIGALLAGAVSFLGMAVWLRAIGDQPRPGMPAVTYFGLAGAVLNVIFSFVIPSKLTGAARKRIAATVPGRDLVEHGRSATADDAGQLCTVYNNQMIIGAALLEGATFFLLIAYIVEGQLISPIVAALLIAGIAWRFPTRERLTTWIEAHERLIAEKRLRPYDSAR
jgi:hypothetical protein